LTLRNYIYKLGPPQKEQVRENMQLLSPTRTLGEFKTHKISNLIYEGGHSMTTKLKLAAFGILFLFLIPFFYSPMELGCNEKVGFKFRPGRLIVLDQPNYLEQGFEEPALVQASKGNIIVFSVVVGYEDINGTTHLPAARIRLNNASKLITFIDFKVTKNAQVAIVQLVNGPITNFYALTEEDMIMVNAKKNVVYRQEVVLDLATADPTQIPVPGLYEIGMVVFPSFTEFPMLKSGGMTLDSVRVEIKK
jgi:hypothetical protein